MGDALLRQGKAGEALNIYAESLRLLNDHAGLNPLPEFQRDVSITLSTVARYIEEQGARAKAVDYLTVELGDLANLKEYINAEIRRLSNAP